MLDTTLYRADHLPSIKPIEGQAPPQIHRWGTSLWDNAVHLNDFLFRAMKSVCDSGRALRPGERMSTFSNFLVSESDNDAPALGHYLVAQRLNIELMFRNIRERYVQPGTVSDLAGRLEPMP